MTVSESNLRFPMPRVEKVPVGTKVQYHGSLAYMHGEYEVTGYTDVLLRSRLDPDELDDHYPGGVAYDLWPSGVPREPQYNEDSLTNVRRKSFTIVEED
jgi:hypothetical protein